MKLNPKTDHIIIYTASWCGPCKMAKQFLKDQGCSFEEIDIEENSISRQEMSSKTKGTSVPQIVINGVPVGGFTDLLQILD